MNGSNGIVPTVDLATNNTYPYPVMYGNGGFGNSGFFGGDGIWALVLLALLFGNNGWGGFGGNGFNNGFNNIATTDYISSEFTQRDVNNGFQNTNNAINNGFQNLGNTVSNGFSANATNICNLRSDLLTGNMSIQNAILDSKYANQLAESQTQRDILLQTTQLENQAGMNALTMQAKLDECCCDLRAQGLENTQRILDAMNQNTIADLREKLNEAQTEISNRNIESSIINSVRPYPTPAWLVSSPYQSIYNPYVFNGGFYGNGFYGNTIV